MSEKRCKTCRWWSDSESAKEHFRDCNNPGMCDPSCDGSVLVYGDSMPLITHGNFGCIHHEEKWGEL
jgi:hypothetical protein